MNPKKLRRRGGLPFSEGRRIAILLLAAIGLASSSATAEDIVVLTAGAYEHSLLQLKSDFEASHKSKLIVTTYTAGTLAQKLKDGSHFDLAILPDTAASQLKGSHILDEASILPVAEVGVGVCVKQGATPPAIDTVEHFRQALIRARTVAYIDPAAGGSSGIYLDQLLRTFNIHDLVVSKAILKKGGRVADLVADGQAELGIQQISEIIIVPGVTLVGPLPPKIQKVTTYVAVRPADRSSGDEIKALLDMMRSDRARSILKAGGMSLPSARKHARP